MDKTVYEDRFSTNLNKIKARVVEGRKNADWVLYLPADGPCDGGYITGRFTDVHDFSCRYRGGWELSEEVEEALSYHSQSSAANMGDKIGLSGSEYKVFTRRERGGRPRDIQVGDMLFLKSDVDCKCPMTVTGVFLRNTVLDTMEKTTGEDEVSVTWISNASDLRESRLPVKCFSRLF